MVVHSRDGHGPPESRAANYRHQAAVLMPTAGAVHRALSRLRHIAGFPSGLVVSFFFSFYLLVNAVTYVGALWGILGVILPLLASCLVTAALVWRWQRKLSTALSISQLDFPDESRLARRRGLVVVVGLDSAQPGTTFLRLLAAAQECEFVALVTTVQDDELGVTGDLVDKVMPLAGRAFPVGNVRVWGGNSAESLTDAETSVTEALAWLRRHGLHPSQMVVDVSKGRRSMQFGALIAADRASVEVQYLAADWHPLDNRPKEGTHDFFVVRTMWTEVSEDAAELEY